MGRTLVSVMLTLICFVFLTGCNGDQELLAKLEQYEVQRYVNEVTEGDFHFRLVSEKDQYNEGEQVLLYGEITYIGELDEITIHHSSSAVFFHLTENVRNYDLSDAVRDIGMSTTLKRNEPFREIYHKNAAYFNENDKQFVSFINDFISRDDFPYGYYVVEGKTDFAVETDDQAESMEHVNIETTIDFKVMKN